MDPLAQAMGGLGFGSGAGGAGGQAEMMQQMMQSPMTQVGAAAGLQGASSSRFLLMSAPETAAAAGCVCSSGRLFGLEARPLPNPDSPSRPPARPPVMFCVLPAGAAAQP